jgi:hypothetical protein
METSRQAPRGARLEPITVAAAEESPPQPLHWQQGRCRGPTLRSSKKELSRQKCSRVSVPATCFWQC